MLLVRDLSFAFGNRPALHNVGFEAARGEVLAIIGPNGSGKSTLLRCIAGLLAPQSGEIAWGGGELPSIARERAKIAGFLGQNFTGEAELLVEEMALLGRTPHLEAFGTPTRADREAVERALERVAADLRGKKLAQLSGGERQRALLARLLAGEAPLLLLDEPISALDIRFQLEVLSLVQNLARDEGKVVVLVLHQLNLAAKFADKLLLLDETGHVRALGAPESVVTADNLAAVYGVELGVERREGDGRPYARF